MDKRLIFAITALGVFSVIVTMIGGDFSEVDPTTYQLIEVPGEIKAGMFWDYNVTNYNTGSITAYVAEKFPVPVAADDYVRVYWTPYAKDIYLSWYYGKVLWFFKNSESIEPFPLAQQDVVDGYDDVVNATTFYMTSRHYEWLVQFSYNQTLYANLTDSINNNQLYVFVGQGNELQPSRMSAWSLVTSILLWNNPDIHWAINFLFAIPLYALMVVVFFYVFTRLVEAVKPFG